MPLVYKLDNFIKDYDTTYKYLTELNKELVNLIELTQNEELKILYNIYNKNKNEFFSNFHNFTMKEYNIESKDLIPLKELKNTRSILYFYNFLDINYK